MKRREFGKIVLRSSAIAALSCPFHILAHSAAVSPDRMGVKKARYFDSLPAKKVRCTLCPHGCRVVPGERGDCGVRENRGGEYFTLVYGTPCSVHIDPIEKKPLFHFHPGANAFSLATAGCNFTCRFCQNWEISQKKPEQVQSVSLPPEAVVTAARDQGCPIIAHTYTEPIVFYEYVLECAILGKEKGIPNVMISNGYINKEPLRELCRYLGAVKIDLKSFNDQFYQEQCGGTLRPVLDTLLTLKEEKTWFEIVVLLIPSLNDSSQEIEQMCRWIFKELGPDVPLHYSRFYPTYQLKNLPPTPAETLNNARQIAMANGLRFVYIGNILSEAENTFCPGCGKKIISRLMFRADPEGLKGNRCRHCNTLIPGVFS